MTTDTVGVPRPDPWAGPLNSRVLRRTIICHHPVSYESSKRYSGMLGPPQCHLQRTLLPCVGPSSAIFQRAMKVARDILEC
ncbi:hypothetical protein J6590_083346 [Homalodisca vitripennis]|nr:hypothetical protein J6590_083346 [Homalodisca vitripennis]